MAIVGGTVATLKDIAKGQTRGSKVDVVVEMLSQNNDALLDIPFKEANEGTMERTTVRTGLPTVYWRMINQPIPPSKSVKAQAVEGTGMLEAFSEVDEVLARLNGNEGAFRQSEATAFVEAMSQEHLSTMFYGNSAVNPQEFLGLAPRYSSLTAPNAQNIINAGGAGSDNTSIWLVGWGAQSVHGIYPKGMPAGVKHDDLGRQVSDAGLGGAKMIVLMDHWAWHTGLVVKDWRYVVRAANIDVSNLQTGTGAAVLTDLMVRMSHRLPNGGSGVKPIFYMNRTAFQYLDLQRMAAVGAGGGIDYANVDGRLVYSFRGFTIRVTDAILDTEAAIV